ncbi:hypothetical protein [Oceanirhabdus seepicola]|uniref:Uncharacterized protein n=1 Tax=Oceanirhabdus seepicola TaxID=2828781 RepID=A0A9J6NWB1_9CLOT|nr:hypothetical protein [Oceanirhabdus seepicola]MCM1988794.1 hypothetical protein [Oceanirhabdus seepicola]
MEDTINEFVKEALIRSTTDLSENASFDDIEKFLSQYDGSQAQGVVNNVKGIAHELEYEYIENNDGDDITAELFGETNHPGSDIRLTNEITGEVTEVQLKATGSSEYVREHMEKYPHIDVMATDEVAQELGIESTGISNDTLDFQVKSTLDELGLEGLDDDLLEYVELQNQSVQSMVSIQDTSTLFEEFGDIMPDILSGFAAGGYLALLDIFKDKPEKQKRVMKAGIATGIVDGFIDFGEMGLEEGFDINPMLLASVASWLAKAANSSDNRYIGTIGKGFNSVVNVGLQTLEYGSYVALGAEVVDLLTGLEVVSFLGDALDGLDFLDVLGDGAEVVDFLDGIASLGVGLIASKAVKSIFKNMNEKDRVKMESLSKRVTSKRIFEKSLKSGMDVNTLIGPYMGFNS